MKNKKRGFTIVELVIVIAVIAILAAVLVPTFSNVIAASKKSAALSTARSAWIDYAAGYASANAGSMPAAGVIKYEKDGTTYYFDVNGATFKGEGNAATTGETLYTLTFSDNDEATFASSVVSGS